MKEQKSKLDPHAARLTEWFSIEKITYQVAQERLERLGCSVSLSRLADWWQARQQEKLQDKLLADIASGARFNRELESQLEKNPPPELQTLFNLMKTLIAQLAVNGTADQPTLKLVGDLMSLVLEERKATGNFKLKEHDLNLKERRIVLLETKAAQADQAKQVLLESKLTEAEKQARIRQIFGMT